MWEEGVLIYGTPGVYNNFPDIQAQNLPRRGKIIIVSEWITYN